MSLSATPPFEVLRWSKPFCMQSGTTTRRLCENIQFVSGMTRMEGTNGSTVLLMMGLNDCTSKAWPISAAKIERLFSTAPAHEVERQKRQPLPLCNAAGSSGGRVTLAQNAKPVSPSVNEGVDVYDKCEIRARMPACQELPLDPAVKTADEMIRLVEHFHEAPWTKRLF